MCLEGLAVVACGTCCREGKQTGTIVIAEVVMVHLLEEVPTCLIV